MSDPGLTKSYLSGSVEIQLTIGMRERLQALVDTGLWGESMTEACQQILCEALRRESRHATKEDAKR